MPYTFNSAIGYIRDDVDGSAVDLFGPEIYTSSQTPQLWLNAFAFEYHGGVVIQADAVDGLFPEGMIGAMIGGYSELLTRLGEPDAWSSAAFDLLPADQRARRTAANDTSRPASERLLHEAFREQAARTPDAPAVLTTSGSLTYGELAGRAASAAAWLRERGTGRDELVALIMRRGPEQITGILAAVMAGAAYLPVDAALPATRIRYMLGDGRVRLALTNARPAQPGWQPDAGQELELLDLSAVSAPGTYAPRTDSSADDLAYVLYTSGTTGEPKGVMISHRSAVNVVTDCNARFRVGPADRFIGLSAFNFDLSVYDVFGALSAGAAIVLPDADRAADPAHWLELCERFGVTIWNSVPAIAGLMAEHAAAGPNSSSLAALRLVMMSGDRIPPALPAALWRVKPGLELRSLGGPTETTIWNISHPVSRAHSELEPVPYGRPNANNRAYIIDADGLDAPDWVTGEICAAGPAWPGATGATRQGRPSGSGWTRPGASGSTARATSAGTCRTAPSTSPAAATSRSRSTATGSRPGRSRPGSPPSARSSRPRWSGSRGRGATGWWRTWWRPGTPGRTPTRSGSRCASTCPTT